MTAKKKETFIGEFRLPKRLFLKYISIIPAVSNKEAHRKKYACKIVWGNLARY